MLGQLSQNGFLQRERQYFVWEMLFYTGEMAVICLRDNPTGRRNCTIEQF